MPYIKNVDSLVKWFIEEYPQLYNAMRSCSHHYPEKDSLQFVGTGYTSKNLNSYHMEGDVWSHTMMCVKVAELSVSNNDTFCTELGLHPLLLPTIMLLHDIGKPNSMTVDEVDKRKRFFSHANISTANSISILHKLNIFNNYEMELILFAINRHGEFFDGFNASNYHKSDFDYLKVLYDTYRCDHLGRFHMTNEGLYSKGEFVDFLIDIAEKSPMNDFRFARAEDAIHVMIGMPCSGKSTYIKSAFPELIRDSRVISRDDILTEYTLGDGTYDEKWDIADHDWINRLFERKLNILKKQPGDLVVDRTSLTVSDRNYILNHVPENKLKIAHVVITPLGDIMGRNTVRDGKTIPEDVIRKMMLSFTLPSYNEFDIINYVIE